VKAPVYKAAPVTLSDWSGFYIGVHGGYGWGHSSIDTPGFPDLEVDTKKGDTIQLLSSTPVRRGRRRWPRRLQLAIRVVTGLEIDFSAADIKTAGTILVRVRAVSRHQSRSMKFDELATTRPAAALNTSCGSMSWYVSRICTTTSPRPRT
jgi:hypothetical protein